MVVELIHRASWMVTPVSKHRPEDWELFHCTYLSNYHETELKKVWKQTVILNTFIFFCHSFPILIIFVFKQANSGVLQTTCLQIVAQISIDFFFCMCVFFTYWLHIIITCLSSQEVLLGLQFFLDQILPCTMLCKQLSIEIRKAAKCIGLKSTWRCDLTSFPVNRFFFISFIINTHPFPSKFHKLKKSPFKPP